MIKDSFNAIGSSARELFRNWRGLALLCALYLALLACVYVFFATGVATVWQLVLSAAAALLTLLFFLLQSAVANFAQPRTNFGALARRTLRDFLKVVLLSLPVIAIAVGIIYLLGKLQTHLPKPAEAPHVYMSAAHTEPPAPLYWQGSLVSSLWLLLLGILLPLVAAHLWLSAARDGLRFTLKRIHRVVARAFAAQSVFVYVVGFFVFAVVPYFILFTRTQVSNGWAELFFFGLRLALAFVLTLWGWTITLGALRRATPTPPEAVKASVPAESATPTDTAASEVEADDVEADDAAA